MNGLISVILAFTCSNQILHSGHALPQPAAEPDPLKLNIQFNIIIDPESLKENGGTKPDITRPEEGAPTTELYNSVGPTCECGQVNRDNRIVGGEETEENEYPWQAAIVVYGTSDIFCGGSVIDRKHILTADKCTQVITDSINSYQVLVGAHGLTNAASSEFRMNATRFIQHPEYNSLITADNDIAIIELANPIDFTSSEVRPVCLPDSDANAYDNVNATVSGWGTLQEYGEYTDMLMEVDVPTMSNSECLTYHPGKITDNMLCAGYENGTKDYCWGDTGGPLVYYSRRAYTQIGVVPWSFECARPRKPGVYTRVTKYLSWIADNTESYYQCSSA